MPIYEYRCGACGHHLEALQKMSRSAAAQVPGVRQVAVEAARLRAAVPLERQRLVRDRLQEQERDEAQSRRARRPDSSEAASDKSTDTAAKDEAGQSRRRGEDRRRGGEAREGSRNRRARNLPPPRASRRRSRARKPRAADADSLARSERASAAAAGALARPYAFPVTSPASSRLMPPLHSKG